MKQVIYVDNTRTRAAYIKVAVITKKLNVIFAAGITIQPGFFLSEIELESGNTAYKFPTLSTEIDNSVFPLSYGVNQNDVFVGIEREFSIEHRSATTDTTFIPQTYVNQFVFTTTNTTSLPALQAIFNSVWDYSVGNKTYIQTQFLRKDLRQPRTQQSSATNYAEYNGGQLVLIDPYLVISGKATNYLNFKIMSTGAWNGGAIDGQGVNTASWYMLGNTLQNAAGFSRFYTGGLDVDDFVEQYNKDKKVLEASAAYGNLN